MMMTETMTVTTLRICGVLWTEEEGALFIALNNVDKNV